MAATRVTTYDPAQVQVSVGGAILTGFEPGTFITITRSQNNFDWSIGPDGVDGIRSKRNDRSALFTFTLRQVSVANLILANLANRDEVDSDGVVPVQVIDLVNSDTQYVSGQGWIEKPSDAVFADSPQGRPWQIRMASVPMNHAGTPSTAALQGTLS